MNSIKHFFDTQLASFDDAAFIRILKIFTIAAALIIAYAFVFSGFLIVDEYEHLHASWLVSIGKLPYKDFLEHHNPLLWYLSAPIVRLFYNHAIIFYVMRFISALASVFTCFYIYKIALFWGDKKNSWLAIAFYLSHIVTIYHSYQFRPDNFMNLCFIAGVYYLFQTLRTNKLSFLTISFLCFTFSFLFLQKITLLLLVVEVILLWLIWSKKLKINMAILASLPSILLLSLFLSFFYVKDFLWEYLEANYRLNHALLSYYVRGGFWFNNLIFSVFGIVVFCAVWFYRKENTYFKITALLFGAEFLMRGFYFAPYPHYYTLLVILSSLLLSVLADKLMPAHKIISAVLTIVLFLNLGHLYNQLERSISTNNCYEHYQLVEWTHKNSKPDDMFMNGNSMIFNVYRPDVSFYWFQFDMLIPVMEQEYNLKKIDLNQIIIQQRPKFVYAANYFDAMSFRLYGERKYAQQFNPELIRTLYKPTPFEGLWELK